MRVLANDGIDAAGKKIIEEAGIEVVTDKIAQADLPTGLNAFDGIIVRSATTVRKELIDANPQLKVIGRAGVGMDNIDVSYAREKGLAVVNTPAASSISVAELVFGHLFTICRMLQLSNREMPSSGATEFNKLKKNYASGVELFSKTIGIIGFGKIGQEVARIAHGVGMEVLAADIIFENATTKKEYNQAFPHITIVSKDEILEKSDFISLHTPMLKSGPMLAAADFAKCKDGVGIINCSRGGIIEESDLLAALESGKVGFVGLDVFENEPTPDPRLLNHPKISVTPHIGGSTLEAQERIGIELAYKIVDALKK